MKKVLSIVLVLVLLVSCQCAAFAQGSKQDLVEVTAPAAVQVTESSAPAVTAEAVAEAVAVLDEDSVKALADAGVDLEKATFTPVMQKHVEVAEGQSETVTITVPGSEDVTIAVFVKTADGTLKLVGVGKPPLDVTLTESGELITTIVK